MPFQLISIAVFLPFAGFLINGLLGSRIKSEKAIGLIGSGTVGISFVIACAMFFDMLSSPPDERSHIVEIFKWIAAGSVNVGLAYQIDQLSILMMLIVTGVGFLIHIYSIGYMHGDPGFWRFFAYLNLFIFAMLNLIMADNFLLLFLGWEGVGLCSYLLIGFWYDRKFDKGTTGDAAKKAFIVNRIGDFGFLIGMFLIFEMFGTLAFKDVFNQASTLSVGNTTVMWMTLALFLGATGKSAQIPLFVWLPDAMAGPTPVSALIHAATMVTAGIYMVARCAVLFALAPTTLMVVAVVGATTALFAASIGLVQNDIKKVLAYSTVSQLGYMFLALGVGAFAAGLFHVLTHAFFKALLFLGSGAVIHAMHEEQDIQKMGGLKSHLPITYKTFLVGTIAIAGIPPLAGFFSKDEILWKAFSGGYWPLWVMGLIGAGLTAFYMFRLLSLTFDGKPRWDQHHLHPHEAPKTMAIPLIVLAGLSIVGGFVGIPHSLGGGNAIEQWLDPVFEAANRKMFLAPHAVVPLEYVLMIASVLVALGGIWLARTWYLKNTEIPEQLASRYRGMYNLLLNKYKVDEVYDAVIVNPIQKMSEMFLWKIFDVKIIDGIVNGIPKLIGVFSGVARKIQTGVTQNYALAFVLGVVLIIGFLITK
ncbi:MAG: NADH-quinone oxidoreductase subunit L [Bacteroidetes bacterium]|nr:NADH-quinone oxidoreductase subunit L [Bacteroidota bacterium]MCW5897040.1 NADH-quinone oxidoreductase subunit L [Bacteroidota bacterium]